MKKLFEMMATNASTIAASTSVITLEEKPIYGTLGEGKVHHATFDWEDGTHADEIIDVEINEK